MCDYSETLAKMQTSFFLGFFWMYMSQTFV